MATLFSWQHGVRNNQTLEPSTKYVLLVLATHMAPDGTGCFPSLSTLAKETGLARSTVCEHLDKAETAGWVWRQKGNAVRSTRYFAAWPEGSPPCGLGSPPHGLGVVRQADPNIPLEHTKEHKTDYAYCGKVIKLSRHDFELWRSANPYVELQSYLVARDAYLAEQPSDIRKRWFVTTATDLRNTNLRRRDLQKQNGRGANLVLGRELSYGNE